MGSKRKRICEKCAVEITSEQDNERHYGTCPGCHRGVNFVLEELELRKHDKVLTDEENSRLKKDNLSLGPYDMGRPVMCLICSIRVSANHSIIA